MCFYEHKDYPKEFNIKSSKKIGVMMKYFYSSTLAQIYFPFMLVLALSQAVSIDNNPSDIFNALFEMSLQNISLFL